jgi:8-oxo-dGTP diphosphatase
MYTTQFFACSFEELKVPEQTKYENPTPIAVAVIPVRARDPKDGVVKTGLLVGERGIEPKKGQLALPGGFMEYEDWKDALRREVFEETGISLSPDDAVEVVRVESAEEGRRVLIFGKVPELSEESLSSFAPNHECPRIKVIFEPEPLAFESHSHVALKFFEETR